MALISCPNCGKPISSRARICPQCNMPVTLQQYEPQQIEPSEETTIYADRTQLEAQPVRKAIPTPPPAPQYPHHGEKKDSKTWLWATLLALLVVGGGLAFFLISNNQKEENAAREARLQAEKDSLSRELKKQEEAALQAERDRIEAERAQIEAEQQRLATQKAQQQAAQAAEQAVSYANTSGTYRGKIKGSTVELQITEHADGSVSGRDRYVKIGQWMDIYGMAFSDGTLSLTESNDGFESGTYYGTVSGRTFRGTFTNYKGESYSFTMTR